VLTLRRISAGGFGLEQAHTIEEVQGLPQDQRAALLMPPKDAALRLLTELPIDTETTLLLRQGKRPEWTGDFSVALATCDGEPIALVELEHSEEGSRLKVVRGFASPPMVGRVAREVACDIPTGDDQAEPADRG
jgi:tRNA U55 pseudouridine synthase TruB